MPDLSHHESHVLALILKWQPTTAYFVRKALVRGPASTFSDSPGSVYAIVERLRRRGLVEARKDEGDGRGTEFLTCSDAGREAVRDWIRAVEPVDLLPEDPWRTRMAHADALTPDERLAWLLALRDAAEGQAALLPGMIDVAGDPCHSAALENARMLNEARLAWIDRIIARQFGGR